MPLQVKSHLPTVLFDFSADFVEKLFATMPPFLSKSYDNIAQKLLKVILLLLLLFCTLNL